MWKPLWEFYTGIYHSVYLILTQKSCQRLWGWDQLSSGATLDCFSTLAITSTEDFEEELTIDEDLQGHDFISLKLQMHNMNTF